MLNSHYHQDMREKYNSAGFKNLWILNPYIGYLNRRLQLNEDANITLRTYIINSRNYKYYMQGHHIFPSRNRN